MDSIIKFPILFLITVLMLTMFVGCGKSSEGEIKIVEGLVFEDCDGNICKGKKVLLQHISTNKYITEIISEDSTFTDNNGYYKFEYREAVDDDSRIYSYHHLLIPNSSIGISNPAGNFDLFPNDTLMNAIVNLKFKNTYTSNDTFYYQFKPSPKGIIEESDNVQYFVGPFNDTTLILEKLSIGNTNSETKGERYCGSFKWGVGKRRLNNYYTGHDGHFSLTHDPCLDNDTFDYLADPDY